MRPDGLLGCGGDAVEFLCSRASYTFDAKTVYPSITLPCHISLFYGVEPMRHGIVSNIITADHGGYDRMHGTDMPEDMTIPMFFIGADFEKNKELKDVSILDIAPTVAAVMGFECEKEWQGRAV